jgi:DNA-directed RNA polymerase subunit RPC12/RpoP
VNDIECPYCGSKDGYFERFVVKYRQDYTWESVGDFASEYDYVKGGIKKYCQECSRDVTVFVNKNKAKS